jgi:hypothetical protein
MIMLPLVFAASFGALRALPQQVARPSSDKYAPPFYMDCGNAPPYKSQSACTPVMTSPDGSFEAYGETNARADSNGGCANTSYVFVRRGDGDYQQVFLQGLFKDPNGNEDGNGVRLIDWSRDSSMLLIHIERWTYASDVGIDDDLRIYDARDGVVTQVPIQTLFGKAGLGKFGEGRFVDFDPLGFSATGAVAMRFTAKQGYEVDGTKSRPNCHGKRSVWLFDSSSNRMTQAPYNYSVKKWGKVR